MTFRVGDRVTLTGSNWPSDYQPYATISRGPYVQDGETSWVVRIDGFPYDDTVEDDGHPCKDSELGKLEDWEIDLLWPDDTEKQEVEPSYYDFPQGIEVRHISAHLTSFGGQALQYVARATRLDGRNKGKPIEDLTKALDFIQWEIDRLRELE